MKFVVCIKQTPNVSELKFNPQTRTLIREGVRNEINPFDRRAITFAVETRKKYGGEVVIMTMGPPQAKDALIEALAMGGDRAVHLLDRAFAGSDTLATARALALAIGKEKPFDLIACGKYSVDAETGHIGPEVAELLGIPHVSGATEVTFSETFSGAVVKAETDYGFQKIECPLPLLLTASERLVKPGRPTAEDLQKASSKPYTILKARDLSEDMRIFGFSGSPTSVQQIYSFEPKRKSEIMNYGSIGAKVEGLVTRLIQHGLFARWENVEKETVAPAPARKISTAKAVWILAELVQGRVRSVTYELLGGGLRIADKLGSELCAVAIGEISDEQVRDLIAHGADRVYRIRGDALSRYSSDAYASALAQAITRFSPFAVIAAATSTGRDFVPRIAARLGLGMTSDCIGFEVNEPGQLVQLKPAFGGNIVAPILSSTLPNLATARPGLLVAAEANQTRVGIVEEFYPTSLQPLAKVVAEEYEADEYALRLDNADVIVCVGAGVGGPDGISVVKQLADLLEAPIAATRKVVDLGWLPRQLQVGLTGRAVSPHLYFAIGVRGAFNHTVGISRAKIVVAINNDPNALIFKNCDYGIVGDYAEVVPQLGEKLREMKAKMHLHGLF